MKELVQILFYESFLDRRKRGFPLLPSCASVLQILLASGPEKSLSRPCLRAKLVRVVRRGRRKLVRGAISIGERTIE